MTINPVAAAVILGFFILIFLARFVRRKPHNGSTPKSDPATIWLSSDMDRAPDRSTGHSTDLTPHHPLDSGPDARGRGGHENDDPGTPDSDGDSGGGDGGGEGDD